MRDEYGQEIKLGYEDDKKEKRQSHRIDYLNFPSIYGGYGATKEEAFEEYKNKLEGYIDLLVKMRSEMDIDNTVDIDCFGKEI